jgi:hypothetical protein
MRPGFNHCAIVIHEICVPAFTTTAARRGPLRKYGIAFKYFCPYELKKKSNK